MRPPVASLPRATAPAELAARLAARAAAAADVLERRRRLVLAGVVVAQWCGIAAIALTASHNGWLYYHGGDGTWYWTDAWALGHFRLPYAWIGYGLQVLWSPAGAVLGPSLLSGLPFVLLFNGLLLAPLAPLLLYGVAARIGGRLFGLFAAVSWLVVPLLAYRMFRPSYRPLLLDNFLPGASGLNSMGDFPSLVACLAAAWLALRALDNRARSDALLAGLVAGYAVGIKPANALFLPAPALALLAARRFRPAAAYAAGLVLPLVALAVWKQRGLGELPLLRSDGQLRLAAGAQPVVVASLGGQLSHYLPFDWTAIQQQLSQLREVFWSKALVEWCAIAGSFALLRRSFAKGLLVVAWFAAYFLVKGSSPFASVYATTFFRLLEPAYPAFVLLAVASVSFLWPRRGRRAAPVEAATPFGRRTTVAAVAVLGVLPLALVGLARPAQAGHFAGGLQARVEVPVVDLGASARVRGRTVALAWRAQHPATGSVAYRIFRSSTPSQDCGPTYGGIRDCVVAGTVLGDPTGSTFVDRPGPGRWIYRVALTGSYDGEPGNGDPLLLSPPIDVSVR